MNIHKILNNNVVITLDEQQQEIILMGRGLGFQKRPGDRLDETQIEKRFSLQDNGLTDRYFALLAEIPSECLRVSEMIIDLAKQSLVNKLQPSLHLSLTDHNSFAIQRHQLNLPIKNVLLWEIKKLYNQEFCVGLQALDIIAQQLAIQLPEDEAGFIALHLVTAQLTNDMQDTLHITQIIQSILQIVKYHLRINYNEDALSYHRFITHLRFFAQRLLGNSYARSDDDSLYLAIRDKYAIAFNCTQKIASYIEKNYQHLLSTDEMMFLTIHIERVRTELLEIDPH